MSILFKKEDINMSKLRVAYISGGEADNDFVKQQLEGVDHDLMPMFVRVMMKP